MTVGGAVIRFGGFGLRILQFCISAIGLGIFSYFLSVLADRNYTILNRWLAVEGITGAATLYTLCAVIFTLCLGGKTLFGFLGMFLDICFVGAYIAVAWFTRHGANSCNGSVRTPLGDGQSDSKDGYGQAGFGSGNGENVTYSVTLGTACTMNTVVFATAIINIFLFLISAAWQILMVQHHKKEKKFGPGPSNNYTKGSGKAPFWKRNRRNKHARDIETTDAGMGAPVGSAVRPSHETGTTLGGNNTYATEPKFGEPGYGQTTYNHRTTNNF